MEFASYLAGERWSDHPRCTHPQLALLARLVNDCSTDEGRGALVPLIPSVVGLNGRDPRVDAVIALRAASAALPVASEARQRALAVGVLCAQGSLDAARGSEVGAALAAASAALASAPLAESWARDFMQRTSDSDLRHFSPHQAAAIVQNAVEGIGTACVLDRDERLRAVLVSAIDSTRALLRPVADVVGSDAPAVAHPDAERSTVGA